MRTTNGVLSKNDKVKQAARRQQAATVLKRLKKEYGTTAGTALRFSTPFELLAATILSAQTTDIQVNKVTERLFRKFRSIEDFAGTPPEKLAADVASVNFYKTKARNINHAAEIVLREFGGEVPRTMQELVSLPGVARKTANIVLSCAFGINEGIAVDTHVKRLAGRLGLSMHEDPVKIEKDLVAATPRKDWAVVSYLLISHGRNICAARNPRHAECVLFDICPSRGI